MTNAQHDNMKNTPETMPVPDIGIQSRILTIRGVQVMLDSDLAFLYGVTTKRLNEQVKRNIARFPERFMFRLTADDMTCLRSQIATSNDAGTSADTPLRSQIATSKRGGVRYLPYAFTEHGITMLASVLNSEAAIAASVRIIDTFVAMRRVLASIAPLLTRIEVTERRQIVDQARNEENQRRNEERFEKIFDAMNDRRFPPQKVFFDGEFFDAFVQMKRFVRQAKKTLTVIDPHFDDSCLPLIAQKRTGVAVTVVRSSLPHLDHRLHAADVAQFNRQYSDSLEVKLSDKFHDRYLIIDGETLIHVGASLNHLGKRCFAFSTLDSEFIPDIMARVP